MSKKKSGPRPEPESLALPLVGVDTHAHLDMEPFEEDLEAVLDRARASGVAAVGNVFLGPEAFAENKALFDGRHEVFFLLGIHPHEAVTCDDAALAAIAEAFRADGRLRALGEIGLDFYWEHSPRPEQERAFRDQLALARELDVPPVVHCRDAEEETLAILEDMGFADRPLLWHCFGQGPELAQELVDKGWHISIPGPVTFHKSELLRQAAARIPLDRLVVETDCPYLTPMPYRGKRNEPAYAVFTAAEIASLRLMAPAELWQRTGDTARAFFGLQGS
jgi:TatD DNase family protein